MKIALKVGLKPIVAGWTRIPGINTGVIKEAWGGIGWGLC